MTLDPQAQAMLQALARLRPFDFATLDGPGYRAVMDRAGLFAPGDAVAEIREQEIAGSSGPLRSTEITRQGVRAARQRQTLSCVSSVQPTKPPPWKNTVTGSTVPGAGW